GIESQAGTAVQAHRGQCQEARREQWPREGNRRADREQGTRPLRGVELGEPYLDPRHVIVTSRWPAVAPGCPGPNLCPAVCPGAQPGHQGPLIDEQDTARACTWPLTLAAARVLKAGPLRYPAALPGVRLDAGLVQGMGGGATSEAHMANDRPVSVSSTDRREETDTGRPGETEEERADRNLLELLQELRVAGLGVQVLFGFLLSLPFTTQFVKLGHPQRELYLASLLLAAISTALLLAPVAYHRLVFRRH